MATILLTEDEIEIGRMVSLGLATQGHTVLLAGDGSEALVIAERERPDLVLIDVGLPDVDGFEVLRRLKQDPELTSVPVIMLTGYTGEADVLAALENGAVDYVTKPFSLKVLGARIEGVLRREAVTRIDPLTGAANRREWDTSLAREICRASRTEGPLCVTLLDLDHFKKYNDEHGHPAGDAFLVEAVSKWGSTLRTCDLLARYGGEEFGVLLPDCSLPDALIVIERLLQLTPGGQTASTGIAAWDGREDARRLVARADTALYQAKAAGRNRVIASAVLPPDHGENGRQSISARPLSAAGPIPVV